MKTVRKLARKRSCSFTGSFTKTKDDQDTISCHDLSEKSSLPPLSTFNKGRSHSLSAVNGKVNTDQSYSLPTFNKGRSYSLPASNKYNIDRIGQAIDSLQSALHLIKAASNQSGPWVDARHLLDETVAALDDA
eukprot:13614020-Ditylum_brightwellii.AAC.1